jgi:hypothetical protein
MYRRDKLRKIIKDASESLPSLLVSECRRLLDIFNGVVTEMQNNQQAWEYLAEERRNFWGKLNPQSYFTFMKRDGKLQHPSLFQVFTRSRISPTTSLHCYTTIPCSTYRRRSRDFVKHLGRF